MVDVTRTGLNNQKRTPCVAVVTATEAEILSGAVVATLPERVVVTGVKSIVKTPSGTASSQVTVKVGATNIAANVAVATAGVKITATPGYFVTGGIVTLNPGATPPAAGDLDIEVMIEYLELDTVNGTYVG